MTLSLIAHREKTLARVTALRFEKVLQLVGVQLMDFKAAEKDQHGVISRLNWLHLSVKK